MPVIAASLAAGLLCIAAATVFFGSNGTSSASVSLTFLFALPAAISALAAYASDPGGERALGHYLRVPAWLLLIAMVVGIIVLREGVICIVMLAPLWYASGAIGSLAVYGLRHRARNAGRLYVNGALLLPLLVLSVETATPTPTEQFTVRRDVLIAAPPERVWPLLLSVPNIGPDEGRWNMTQDVLGVPRPLAAAIVRRGPDLVRQARWGQSVRFEEQLNTPIPMRRLDWSFSFPDGSVREHTDQHISPDGAHLRIAQGGYRLVPQPGGGTRLILDTKYLLRSPLNGYAALWGELFLGDIHRNILGVVKDRAEASQPSSAARTKA